MDAVALHRQQPGEIYKKLQFFFPFYYFYYKLCLEGFMSLLIWQNLFFYQQTLSLHPPQRSPSPLPGSLPG